MSVAFDPRDDLIVIPTRIAGPKGEADLRLALDTGASVSADRQRKRFPVLCHTLPPSATVDGLLGLDFLRKRLLTIDFASGLVSLT